MFADAAIWVIITGMARGFSNVAFTGSLLVSLAMVGGIIWYSKRRKVGEPLSWGQAMVGAVYIAFLLFWFFGVVPHQWLTYAQGELSMRSDSILAGPGSTGIAQWSPIVISKSTIADLVTVNIYMVGMVAAVFMWAVWQRRGDKQTDEVETSTYGRPLVKA